MNDRFGQATAALELVLKPAGFKRTRHTWVRRVDGFIDVVNVQLSKSLERLWVNLGVADPDAYERSWGKPMGRLVDEASCTVRARLGLLLDNHDHSWEVASGEGAADMADTLRAYGLPWLDRKHSLAAMEETLAREFLASHQRGYPPVAIALAVVQWKQGRRQAACETLDARRRAGLGAWSDRVDALGEALGCTPALT